MHQAYRLLASLIIWLAVVGIIAIIFLSPGGASAAEHVETVLGALAILGGAAGFGTYAVWRDAGHSAARATTEPRAARKAKDNKSRRVSRLIDLLDDDELVELETLLLAREPERLSAGR